MSIVNICAYSVVFPGQQVIEDLVRSQRVGTGISGRAQRQSTTREGCPQNPTKAHTDSLHRTPHPIYRTNGYSCAGKQSCRTLFNLTEGTGQEEVGKENVLKGKPNLIK